MHAGHRRDGGRAQLHAADRRSLGFERRAGATVCRCVRSGAMDKRGVQASRDLTPARSVEKIAAIDAKSAPAGTGITHPTLSSLLAAAANQILRTYHIMALTNAGPPAESALRRRQACLCRPEGWGAGCCGSGTGRRGSPRSGLSGRDPARALPTVRAVAGSWHGLCSMTGQPSARQETVRCPLPPPGMAWRAGAHPHGGQVTLTLPGLHGWPYGHCSGYVRQSGRS
jgi:hypothetical protein